MPPKEVKKEEINKNTIPVLRTLKTDTAEYVQKSGISMVDVVAAEAKKREGSAIQNGEEPFNKKIIIISIIAVTVLFLGTVVFFIFRQKPADDNVEIVSLKPIIISDSQKEVILKESAEENVREIKKVLNEKTDQNTLLYLPIYRQEGEKKTLVEPEDFLKAIGSNIPLKFSEALDDKFMLGKICPLKCWPILVFKINYYQDAFAGMIEWEKWIADNLSEIFSLSSPENISTSFKDKEIQNHDVRILSGQDDAIILAYSFFSRNYLVMTVSEEPLQEVFRRLSSPRYLNE